MARVDAHVYHYGWVRPPKLMGKKQAYFGDCYAQNNNQPLEDVVISEMDFGAMGTIPLYKASHPKVMANRLNEFNWANQLNYSNKLGRKAVITSYSIHYTKLYESFTFSISRPSLVT